MTLLYTWILKTLKPFVKWWGKLHLPFTKKLITGEHYFIWRDSINVGDVLLTSTYGELSNLINPADIKHAGIYIGYVDGIPTVAEALGKGIVYTDLVTFLTTKDLVVNCRPDFLDTRNRAEISIEAYKRKGLPYDYVFSSGNKGLYCFELAVDIFKTVIPNVILKQEEVVKGFKIYDENTFLDPNHFSIIFDSRTM